MDASPLDSNARTLEYLISDQATTRPSAPYLLEARGSRIVTYGLLQSEVLSRGEQLRAWGIGSGDRIGMMLDDPLAFAQWFLAALATGVWVAPMDPSLTATRVDRVEERARSLKLGAIVSDRVVESEVVSWFDVNDPSFDAASPNISLSTTERRGGGVLLSSSGTTGEPKVVALSTAQLLDVATLVARHNRLEVEDRGFNSLPFWHVNAEVVGLLSTLVAGASLVLDDRFHRTGFWKIVDDFDVTWVNAVPAIIARLVNLEGDERAPSRVRFVRSASAPLSPTLFERFEETTGVPIIQSYGMTEAASQICVNPLDGVRKAGSAGVPVGVDVRIGADESVSSNGDSIGQIEIKGPTVITAYESAGYEDRFDAEGWLRTGDLGYFDEDGYLFIVGRSDDVINRGGEKVYPLEIENALIDVEGVALVAVVGEPDDVFGQVPVAYVQPEPASILDTPEEIVELVARIRERILTAFPKAKRPVALKFAHAFPLLATGKVRKGLFREGAVLVAYEERL
jgi:acyl-CoA synthetase (AMP-forming)/AMP-acid ligase II